MCEGEATWAVVSAYRARPASLPEGQDRVMGEADLGTVRVA